MSVIGLSEERYRTVAAINGTNIPYLIPSEWYVFSHVCVAVQRFSCTVIPHSGKPMHNFSDLSREADDVVSSSGGDMQKSGFGFRGAVGGVGGIFVLPRTG
jgi:hypothetical protein